MTGTRSRLALGLAVAALAICAAAGGAGAVGLVGSRGIADDSIRSVDVKNQTVTGRDVKDSSLRSDVFAGGLPDRTPGPDRILTWSGSFKEDGSIGENTPLIVSSDTIPAASMLRGINLTVTGDHSKCGALDVAVAPADTGWSDDPVAFAVLRAPVDGGDEVVMNDLVTNLDAPIHLAIAAGCLTTGDNAVPSFDFTVTFSVTQLDMPPTTTWH